jgi:translocation and assembly module TamB
VPVQVDGRVGPLVVQRVGLPADGMHGGPRVLRAEVRAELTARGTANDPEVKLMARADRAQMGNRALGNAELRVAYQDRAGKLDAAVASANGGKLQLGVQAKADLSLAAVRRGLQVREIPIQGRLTSRSLDLGILSGLNDTVRSVAGLLEADGQLGGTVGTPQVAGQVAWKKGRLQLAGLGEYRDIDLAFRGDGQQMVLERLFARSGEGNATLSGKAVRGGDGRQLALEARAHLHRFSVYTEGQPLGAVSVDATAKGNVAPDRILVAVSIPEAQFYMAEGNRKHLQPLKRPPDVVIFDNGRPRDRREEKRLEALASRTLPPPAPDQLAMSSGTRNLAGAQARDDSAAAGQSEAVTEGAERAERRQDDRRGDGKAGPAPVTGRPRRLRVTIEADRNLWVRGPDMNLELGLDPGFIVLHTDEPRVFGTVKVKRGYVEVMGRRFDVDPSSAVTFGGPPDLPRLAVTARYKVERDGAATTVVVRAEGPADRLSFTLQSPEHPEYGDTELLSLVVTGRVPDEAGDSVAPGDRAASLVGGMLASKIQKALAKRLPLDVLTIEPGSGGLAGEGARLEAGTYLGDDVYVAYVGRLGVDPFLRQNRNEVHLEYQLSSRWSFEASYGDARQGSADLLWTRNY